MHYCLQLGKKNTRKLFWAIVTGRLGNINTGKSRFTVVTARQKQNKTKKTPKYLSKLLLSSTLSVSN